MLSKSTGNHFVLALLLIVWLGTLSSCGVDDQQSAGDTPQAGMSGLEGVVFPEEEWISLTAEEAFPDDSLSYMAGTGGSTALSAWTGWVEGMEESVTGGTWKGEDHGQDRWGIAIAWRGYLLQTFGNPDYRFQTASLGKAFNMACLQLAIDKGLIGSADDLVMDYWIGAGELNSKHKFLDQGHHRKLTFRHLAEHVSGLPVTNGDSWQKCQNYENIAPEWATCTGDPDYDNYSHAEPGTMSRSYSSGAYWRLSQALTAVWEKSLKQVMDEHLLSKIGIPPERWDWTPGTRVRHDKGWYPEMPDYGLFLDPPYEVEGQVVVGGPGWVVMSAKDLARFGLLVATRGVWKGERLISDTPFLRSHGGGNGSLMAGVGGGLFLSLGRVTTTSISLSDLPLHLFAGNRPRLQGQ